MLTVGGGTIEPADGGGAATGGTLAACNCCTTPLTISSMFTFPLSERTWLKRLDVSGSTTLLLFADGPGAGFA